MPELFAVPSLGLPEQWRWQAVFMGISLIALSGYFLGYVLAVRNPPRTSLSPAGALYGSGIFASLAWYVMPFLPQPRLPGLLDLGNHMDDWTVWLGAAAQVYGIIVGTRFFLYSWRSTLLNLSVTKHNVFAPERLLTDGVYGQVRHPMLSGDAIAHLGVAMACAGSLTVALYVVYYLINEAFVTIQERMILLPRFGDAYRAYTRQVPRMFNTPLGFTFGLGVGIAVAALAFCLP